MIKYGCQDITDEDVQAVLKTLKSEFLTQGPAIPKFENYIASKVGAQHGIAVNSATSALHAACLALDLGEGDWLWTSAISFVASANCGVFCSASIDFVDVNPCDFNICVEALEEKLIHAKKLGKLPKVLVVVHMAGQSCNMFRISQLAQEYGFKIIEDASHAVGAKYRKNYVGSCVYSDIAVFSFHPVKIITTTEGGMALTNNAKLGKKLRAICSHGISRDLQRKVFEKEGPWFYEQQELGFNFRMTDIQAALGLSQSKRLDDYISTRNLFAQNYNQELKGLPIILPEINPDCISSFHLYVIQFKTQKNRELRRFVYEYLHSKGIGVNVHYFPIYLQPYYKKFGFKSGLCPNAELYYSRALTLPLHPNLSAQDLMFVVKQLKNAIEIGSNENENKY